MKNYFDSKPKKLDRPVKKWDVHGCSLCPAIERFSQKLWKCGMKNKVLEYMAAQKNVIPEWCPLEDYEKGS